MTFQEISENLNTLRVNSTLNILIEEKFNNCETKKSQKFLRLIFKFNKSKNQNFQLMNK